MSIRGLSLSWMVMRCSNMDPSCCQSSTDSISRLPWLGFSPSMSPIERAGEILGRRDHQMPPSMTTALQLQAALKSVVEQLSNSRSGYLFSPYTDGWLLASCPEEAIPHIKHLVYAYITMLFHNICLKHFFFLFWVVYINFPFIKTYLFTVKKYI